MYYDTVIWDFNGTLVDDAELGIFATNTMLRRRGLREMSGKEEYRERFHIPVIDYYRGLGFDFEREPYTELAKEWFDLYLAGEPDLLPMPEAKAALELVRHAGMRQIVLSASESALLNAQIERFGFGEFFDEIIGKDNFLAEGKAESARRRLGDNNHRCAMIGDTGHDFDTAAAIGADAYLYSGGHEATAKLKLTGAVVSDSLVEICKMIVSKN